MNKDTKKVLILYFSGTGNTYFCAKAIASALYNAYSANTPSKTNSDLSVSLESVEVFRPEDVKLYDILIFGFPVYALKMPEFLEEYVERLSLPKTKKVFIFATYGFYPGNAQKLVARKMKQMGFIPIGTGGVRLPGTDGLLFIKKDSRAEEKIKGKNYAETRRMKRFLRKVTESLYSKKNTSPGLRLTITGILSSVLFNIVYKPIETATKKRFYANNTCTHCRLCELICPSGNITVTKTKVIFSDKCYLCLRCIHQCPEEAIQIGRFTLNSIRYRGPDNSFYPLSILRNTKRKKD